MPSSDSSSLCQMPSPLSSSKTVPQIEPVEIPRLEGGRWPTKSTSLGISDEFLSAAEVKLSSNCESNKSSETPRPLAGSDVVAAVAAVAAAADPGEASNTWITEAG